MPEPLSWRDLLKDVISDTSLRERLANEMGIRAVTLARWSTGESKPRPQNLLQLLHVFPQTQRKRFAELLREEYHDLLDGVFAEPPDEIEYQFIRQIFDARATTPEHLLCWTLCHKVIRHALGRLDPEGLGMAIRIMQCMPPSHTGKIRSLRERFGQGTPPWPQDLEQVIDDLRADTSLLPTSRREHEVSVMAHPLMYANRIAGCLLLFSTQVRYFFSQVRRVLVRDYAQLITLAFHPGQFYPLEYIELQMMPSLDIQHTALGTFQQRVNGLMREAYNVSRPLTRDQAEEIVWQQIEEELINSYYR
jgi:transcriptional regulator with XRE-family HTH domain